MDNLYISHRSLYAQQTAFEHSVACLSVVFELLPGFIPFAILWHSRGILDKNVNMNNNYRYPTTICESILTQIYVFLVLFTSFDFHHKIFICKTRKNIFFYQKFVHLGKTTLINCSTCSCTCFFFSIVHPVCHKIANRIKQGSN